MGSFSMIRGPNPLPSLASIGPSLSSNNSFQMNNLQIDFKILLLLDKVQFKMSNSSSTHHSLQLSNNFHRSFKILSNPCLIQGGYPKHPGLARVLTLYQILSFLVGLLVNCHHNNKEAHLILKGH